MCAAKPADTALENEEADDEDDDSTEDDESGRAEVGNSVRHESLGRRCAHGLGLRLRNVDKARVNRILIPGRQGCQSLKPDSISPIPKPTMLAETTIEITNSITVISFSHTPQSERDEKEREQADGDSRGELTEVVHACVVLRCRSRRGGDLRRTDNRNRCRSKA